MSERVKRDCHCPRARHQHGTYAAYQADHCRCLRCSAAMANTRNAYKRAARGEGPKPVSGRLVDGTGTARRLQALATIGWGGQALAEHLGVSHDLINHWTRRVYPTVSIETATRVAEIYDRLSMTVLNDRAAKVTRTFAAKHGYLPPLAWDDDEIDQPDAQPHTPPAGPHELAPCGTLAAARRHYRHGEQLDADCAGAMRRDKNDRAAAARRAA